MGDAKNQNLFGEFPSVSTEQWESQIKADLKGADYVKKLVWQTVEGLKVLPYYRSQDLQSKEYLNALPGEFPYIRGNKTNSNDWEIRQDIKLEVIAVANDKSLFILERGISALGFITSPIKDEMILKTQADFSNLMKDIYFDCIKTYFVCGFNAPAILNMIRTEVELKNLDPEKVSGGVDFDPLGYLTFNGNWSVNEDADMLELQELIQFAEAKLPEYRILGINGYFFNNAGASVVQELGYTLSMANDYLAKLTTRGISIDSVCKHMLFNFGTGANYFLEIAKIRAFRLLWSKIVEAYKPTDNSSCKTIVHSITSEWNQTVYDPYVNVLRATTESMAAVIGGADSLTVRPFDFAYRPTSKFSGRLARNIQIILKEEAYLDRIVDPGAGSYYIENLTDSIIDESWKLFLKIEDEGGYLNALKKGIVQADIEATAQNRDNLIATRREILVGTNQYPNFNENADENFNDSIAFQHSSPENPSIKPIKKYRGAIDFEKLRLAVEKHPGKKPMVFMLTYGNLAMRKVRATFACNFFACAGYEVVDNLGFQTAEDGVKKALAANADIIVICSSDDEYTEIAPAVFNLVNDKAIVVVAGAPASMDELKQKGLENFIHMKSNLLETLKSYHHKMGIKI
jgi:methylmalonyl-CoA mutase